MGRIDVRALKQKIRDEEWRKEQKQKHFTRESRNEGNTQQGDLEREMARAGRATHAKDIPAQDKGGTRRNPTVNVKGNLSDFELSTDYTRGQYRLGPPRRPNIGHDSGFSKFPKEEPTRSDYWNLLKWYGMLEGAEALRPDLTDAVAAYRHFHEGEGRARTFSYDRYVNNDDGGRLTFHNAVLEAQYVAIDFWEQNGRTSFQFTGPTIPCGGDLDNFPYPYTENWQKAIGAHAIWLSASVTVNPGAAGGEPSFTMHLTLHAEDQYNFNPGQADIATNAPDDDNGRFVIVGWAHGYRHTAELKRTIRWTGTELGVPALGINPRRRARQPQNNRRTRNRI